MARIFKLTDKIPVKIDDVTITISPLSVDQKTDIQNEVVNGNLKGDFKRATRGIVLALKYSIKDIQGVKDGEGNDYKLQFGDDKFLTEDCVADLLNLHITDKLTMFCIALANGVPEVLKDSKGRKIEGVEIVKAGKPVPNS